MSARIWSASGYDFDFENNLGSFLFIGGIRGTWNCGVAMYIYFCHYNGTIRVLWNGIWWYIYIIYIMIKWYISLHGIWWYNYVVFVARVKGQGRMDTILVKRTDLEKKIFFGIFEGMTFTTADNNFKQRLYLYILRKDALVVTIKLIFYHVYT